MADKERLTYIDAVAGLMIGWMILGHCSYFSHYSLSFFKFLGFYMPWFFYKSGMFFSPKKRGELFWKDVHKFIRLYVVYCFLGWIIWAIFSIINGSSIVNCIVSPVNSFVFNGAVTGNGALWFLLSLFFVRQASNVALKKVHPPFLAIVCFIIAFALNKIGWYNYSWWLGNIFSGMFFFLMGYYLKDKEDNIELFLTSIIVFGCVLLAYFVGWIMDFPYLYMHANKMYRGDYVLFYPMALAGIIMTNNVFRIVCKYVRFYILGYIGRKSMYFYVTHWILFIAVVFIAKSIFHIGSAFHLFIILLCSSVVFLPLISRSIDALKSSNNYLNKIL